MKKANKEIVIPVTGKQIVKVVIALWLSISIISFIYGIIVADYGMAVFIFIFGIMMGLFGLGVCSIEFDWDLNPFHKIGYCIRLAEDWELKEKKTSITSSQEGSQ